MNHYCTYFDRGFLIPGLAMWRSLRRHDAAAALWVLALDDFTAGVLRELRDPELQIVTLAEVERDDLDLVDVRPHRSRVEYYFTLSPCWPRWLFAHHPEIDRLTYVDADMFFFAPPTAVHAAMDRAGASVLITSHRFPPWLRHYEQHGLFNVGLLSFRNDSIGLHCVNAWRDDCLAWCHDRVEPGRYADQKYLESWPGQYRSAVLVCQHPGVNLAPWNWATHRCVVQDDGAVLVDGEALVVFHFARFRPLRGTWWWQSGQLDYGVMPARLRHAVYGPYWHALALARAEIRERRPGFDFARRPRLERGFWRGLPLRLVFGSDWLRLGHRFHSGRGGLGRFSGRALAFLRRLKARR